MLISSRNSTPGGFAVRRVIRIVPLYWALTTLLVALALLAPAQFRTTVLSVGNYLRSLLFIPYLNPGHPGELFPLLVPGWSLNLEMFFYVVFAVALFAPPRLRLWSVGLVLGALVAVGMLASPGALSPQVRFYTDLRLVEFWLGMLIAQLSLRGWPRLPRPVSLTLVAAAFALLITGFPVNLLQLHGNPLALFGTVLPAAVIVCATVALEREGGVARHPFLHWLGDASYSIYLSHIFSLGLARLLWARLGLEQNSLTCAIGFGVFGMALVVAGAWLTYVAIEKPSLAALQRRVKHQHPVATVQPA